MLILILLRQNDVINRFLRITKVQKFLVALSRLFT